MNKGKQIKPHLIEKRNEYIWSLAKQEYTGSEIADVFNMSRSRIHAIISKMPSGWTSPWKKQ